MSPSTRSSSRKVLLALATVSLVVIGTSASIPSVSSSLSKPLKKQKQTFQQRIHTESDSSSTNLSDVRGGAVKSESTVALLQNAKVGFYFALWYTLNIYYNSKSKEESVICRVLFVYSFFLGQILTRRVPFNFNSSYQSSTRSY
jgi:hypothetical protein